MRKEKCLIRLNKNLEIEKDALVLIRSFASQEGENKYSNFLSVNY